ncbi:ComF family protein [Aliiroseovarius sp. PTFE2010]|uniref:ComF family protein n=1 Tax=Aliiroseovarius sp. PTFE2010 TaxID=3417190 RepID=UPI003CEE0726
MAQLKDIVRVLYPPHCISCNEIVAEEGALCGPCRRNAVFLSGLCCDQCAAPLPGDADDAPTLCDQCTSVPRRWDHGRAATLYSGTSRRVILAIKHSGQSDVATALGQWVASACTDLVSDTSVLVPVPLHWLRRLKRGYNQSELIARVAAKQLGVPMVPNLLTRVRHGEMMKDMDRAARASVLEGAFALNPRTKLKLAGRHVILIDDVMTTGATLDACTKVCLENGANRVSVAVVARVAKVS